MVSWFPPSSCGRSPRHEPAKEREGAPSSFPLRSRLNLFKVPSFFLAVLKALAEERVFTDFFLVSRDMVATRHANIQAIHWEEFLKRLWQGEIIATG